MAERRRQHYVPRFYLRYFSSHPDRKTIGVYNLRRRLWIPHAGLKDQAYAVHFYGRDVGIENALAVIESEASKILMRMLRRQELPEHGSWEHELLLIFVLSLSERTLQAGEAINETIDKFIKVVFKQDPRFRGLLDDVRIGWEHPATVSLGMALQYVPAVLDLDYKLLRSERQGTFITSDHPVVKYNQFLEGKTRGVSNVGFATVGLQIFLPLDPETCIIFYDPAIYKVGNRRDRVVQAIAADVDALNILQAANAWENLYCHPEMPHRSLDAIVARAMKHRRRELATVKEYPLFGRPGERIVHTYRQDLRTRLRPSFVSLTRKARRYILGNQLVPFREKALARVQGAESP